MSGIRNLPTILLLLIGFAVFVASGAVQAEESDSIAVALALGTVLGSEGFCNLSFDQAAIKRFVAAKVKQDDMQFPSTLTMMTEGTKFQNTQMSPSEKTAHCAQIERVARSYEFIK